MPSGRFGVDKNICPYRDSKPLSSAEYPLYRLRSSLLGVFSMWWELTAPWMTQAAKNCEVFTAFALPMHSFSDEVSWSLLGFGPASRPHATEQTGP